MGDHETVFGVLRGRSAREAPIDAGPEAPGFGRTPQRTRRLIVFLLVVIVLLALAVGVLLWITYSGFTMDH